MTRRFGLSAIAAAAAAALAAMTGMANAQQLEADLSDHLVAIDTGFTGAEVTLFGTRQGPGEVIAVVRAPQSSIAVRRQQRILGIWIPADKVSFADVPAFYAVASSAPLTDLLPEAIRQQQGIGLDQLEMVLKKSEREADTDAFQDALGRLKREAGLYVTEIGKISFLGQSLFRTTLHFPANLPTGGYRVDVYLVRGGEIVGAQTVPLTVGKVGVSNDIFQFAHRQPAAYGLVAITLAILAGWLAHLVFRRL